MTVTKQDILFAIASMFAVWFALVGMVWTYWIALVIAYPFGIISYIIWRRIRNENKNRNIFIPITLSIGLILSLSTLVYLLIKN